MGKVTAESVIQAQVRLAASKLGYVLWRNNRGAFKDNHGRLIRYGVGSDGAGDLIGYVPITITPDMVGEVVAVFASVECKAPGAKTNKEHLARQKEFIDRVRQRGGIAAMVDSSEQIPPPLLAFSKWRQADSN